MAYSPLKPNRIREMNQIEKVWLACAIDAEGSMSLHFTFHKRANSKPIFCASIEISNTNQDFIKRVSEITGVTSRSKPYLRFDKKHHSPCYTWGIQRALELEYVLKQIYPYLIIKKTHADVIFKFINLVKSRVESQKYSEKHTFLPSNNKYNEQYNLAEQLSILNMKGNKSRVERRAFYNG